MGMRANEQKTMWVVVLTALTMVVEIGFGISTNSMALLADGIHMGSHVFAIGLSWLAYVFVRKLSKRETFKGNADKILSLSGYSSALILFVFVFVIVVEAFGRFFEPSEIDYSEAITVAIIGMIVNIISAFMLHHKEHETDHNIKAAYFHVLADALTSLAAIVGLFAAMWLDVPLIDPIVALASSAVIIKWSVGLLKESGRALLDIGLPADHHHHTHHH